MHDKEILACMTDLLGNIIPEIIPLPKPYPDNIESPKAILLGCDPTNLKYNIRFEYVFALERTHPEFDSFLKKWDDSLKAIGLTFENIYTQNLCRNYFSEETSGNKIWDEAAQFWIPYLKDELSRFDINVPVLMSSEKIYKVLLCYEKDYLKPEFMYSNPALIPLPPEKNKLERPLIPFYRHPKYDINFEKWNDYKKRLLELIE